MKGPHDLHRLPCGQADRQVDEQTARGVESGREAEFQVPRPLISGRRCVAGCFGRAAGGRQREQRGGAHLRRRTTHRQRLCHACGRPHALAGLHGETSPVPKQRRGLQIDTSGI
eukprot:COSAG01_NODE_541_length_15735_cov_4.534088_18_plen_114_part_00